jgi:uncharacterized protein
MLRVEKFVSADGHLTEPDDLWVTRMEPRFRDRAPRVVAVHGKPHFVVDETSCVRLEGRIVQATDRKQADVLEREAGGRHEKVRPGGLDPHLRLIDQDVDSVAAEVLYPDRGLFLYGPQDSDYQRDTMRVYNDFCIEYCSAEPGRLCGVAMLSLRGPVETAIKDAQRCAAMGFRGVMIPARLVGRSYFDAQFEPLWSALEDLDLNVAIHVAAREDSFLLTAENMELGAFSPVDHRVIQTARTMAGLIAAAIPQRHPRLRLVFAECGIGWIAGVLRFMDHWWTDHRDWIEPHLDETPSFYFKRNFWVSFEDDRPGLLTRHLLNVDHLMWGSDYPHSEGTFPYSRRRIEQDFADIADEETRKMVRDNAIGLWRFPI